MPLEYLKRVFGETAVKEFKLNFSGLPLYLSKAYRFYGISVYGKKYVFVQPENKLNLKAYKAQKKKIEEIFALSVVLCADKLIFQQRDNLINSGIEFVEPKRQIYMPSLGLVLDNRRSNTIAKQIEKFTPQMQLCALFFLYKSQKEYTVKEISEITGLNDMAVSRGASFLTELELLSVRKVGRINYYTIRVSKNELLASIKDYLISPILKKLYAKEVDVKNIGVKAGYTALSQSTTISDDFVKTYAVSRKTYKSIENNCKEVDDMFLTDDGVAKIEVWKYDPAIFAVDNCVDKLSLYLSFTNGNDERSEEALKELMREIKNG